MIRTQEATGKTVDEARANACAKLGVQADDINVSYEVLEMPQKTGFLGLKLTPAKVRVTVEEADPVPAAPVVEEKAAPAPVAEEPKAEEKTPAKRTRKPKAAPAAEEKAPAKRGRKPKTEAAPAEEKAPAKRGRKPKAEKAEEAKPARKPRAKKADKAEK